MRTITVFFVFVAASSSVVTAEFLSCGNGAESNCCDKHESCAEWARNNECENNPEWMLPNCQLSCHSCETHTSQCGTGRESNCCDQHPSCASWAQQGECQNNPEWMLPNCPLSCHNCDSDEATTDPSMCGTGKESNCCDKHPSCASWAQQGECQNNPEWMLPNCQLSCHSCETESDEPSTETSMCGTGNESNCCDKHPNCAFWARRRECKSNPDWMLPNCPLSCRNCGTDFDKQTTKVRQCGTGKESECCDHHSSCAFWASKGECRKDPDWMLRKCQLSCHFCQTEEDEPLPDPSLCGTGAQSDCCDSHPSCPYWASVGECTRNRNYMQLNCMRSCDTCLKDPFARHLARRSGQWMLRGRQKMEPLNMRQGKLE